MNPSPEFIMCCADCVADLMNAPPHKVSIWDGRGPSPYQGTDKEYLASVLIQVANNADLRPMMRFEIGGQGVLLYPVSIIAGVPACPLHMGGREWRYHR